MRIVAEIAEFIHQKSSFLITSHSRPDGDSLGSALAVAAALQQLGKSAQVVNADPHPRMYDSLPGIDEVIVANQVDGRYEGLIVLECSNLDRTGVKGLERFEAVNIDHHLKNDEFGLLNWVDAKAAAVAEMVFQLFHELEIRITPEIATNLYVAILTDTGSFQFSNTTAQTFGIARQLVSAGAQPAPIAQAVLMNQPESRLRLLCRVLSSLTFESEGKIAWLKLTERMLEETGSTAADSEGMVNYALSVDGVKVCALFKQEQGESYRVSLRSRGEQDVSTVAQHFGGGGHRNAAGLSIEGPFEEVCARVVNQLEALFP
jgi:phosphoesterase RecJ-like protein